MNSHLYQVCPSIPIGTPSIVPVQSQPQNQSSHTSQNLYGVRAGLLIPGCGEPVKDAILIIHLKTIAWVGVFSSLPQKYTLVPITHHVPYLLPGLWDVHCHFLGNPSPTTGFATLLGSSALAGARSVKDLHATLMAGFTSVRELGGYGGEIAPAIDDGTILGPHVYSSMALISQTGGHGDIHDLPMKTVLDACAGNFPFAICDGVPDCIRTVRLLVRRGAKVIKVAATGGVFSLLDAPTDVQFSPEELKAMVHEAARTKRVVAAHCHGKEGIMAAINAGVKTIEHGSFLDSECAKLMKEKDIIYVPTASVQEGGSKEADKMPESTRRKILEVAAHARRAYKIALREGVKIALGTDQASSLEGTFNSHGRNGKEIYWAVKAGMSPLEAIEACTAVSPETLGSHMMPRSGQLSEGFDADFIAVGGNPLVDVGVLARPEMVTHVWKDGKLVKSP